MSLFKLVSTTMLVITLAVLPAAAQAGPALTHTQAEVLRIGLEVGSRVTFEGENFAKTGAVLAMKESNAGMLNRNVDGAIVGDGRFAYGERAYGPWQVRLIAYFEVIKYFPHLKRYVTKEEVIAALLYNKEYCAEVAVHYFVLMYKQFNKDYKMALLAYNRGPGAARRTPHKDPNNYVKHCFNIKKHIVEPYMRGDYFITGART